MQWLVLKIKNYHLYENKKPDRFCSRLARVAVCGSYLNFNCSVLLFYKRYQGIGHATAFEKYGRSIKKLGAKGGRVTAWLSLYCN